MSWFKRSAAPVEDQAEERSEALKAWLTGMSEGSVATASGETVHTMSSERLASVYFAQSLIADGVASLPIDVYQTMPDGNRRAVTTPDYLTEPNPFQDAYGFWHMLMISLLADGNAFIRIVRNPASGVVKSLYVLHPYLVEIEERAGAPVYVVGAEGDDQEALTKREILHIPAFVKPGEWRGISPIEAAKETVGLALAAEEFGARFFSQGTTMAGVIRHPGNPRPGEVALIRKMFRKTQSGVKNSHAIGILSGGAEWVPISVTPEQAQFLETRKYQDVQVGKLYRVPAYMMDPSVTSSWGTGVEEQNKFFVTWTLMPWITRIEQAFSRAILPPSHYMKLNTRAWMRGKDADRAAYYHMGIQDGWLNSDDVRELEDYEPLPDGLGQKFYRPANLTEVGRELGGAEVAA